MRVPEAGKEVVHWGAVWMERDVAVRLIAFMQTEPAYDHLTLETLNQRQHERTDGQEVAEGSEPAIP